jgi:hypothetical protein
LRFLIWAIILSAVLFSFSILIYLQVVGGLPSSPPLILLVIFITPAYLSVGSGAAVLLIAVRRTADKTLRKHLEWFGFYLVFIFVFGGLVGIGIGFYSIELSSIVGGAANAAAAWFLYRSARSLVPLYRFSDEASQPDAVAKTTSITQ